MTTRNMAKIIEAQAAIAEQLGKLLTDANSLIERKSLTFFEARNIAASVAEVNRLLGAWAGAGSTFFPPGPMADELRILKERAWDLEGAAKEIRNNLGREQRSDRLEARNR